MPKKSLSLIVGVVLALFILVNPNTGYDILAFLALALIILYKIFGEYVILLLLAARPTIDQWRDFVLFSYENFNININAALAALLFLWAAYFLVNHRRYWKILPLRRIWPLFIFWCAASFIWSYDRGSTVIETVKAADLFALFGVSYVLYAKYGEKYANRLHLTFLVSAIAPLAVAAYQFFTRSGMNIDDIPNRLYGTFAHPNILATFSLLLFMTLVNRYLLLEQDRPVFKLKGSTLHKNYEQKMALLLAGCLLLAAAVTFTYTRIAWIGLALFLLIQGLFYCPKLLLRLFLIGALGYALFFPLNAFLVENFNVNLQSNQLIARLTSRNPEADSIQWRSDVARKVMPLLWQRPIAGYGYGAFAKVWDNSKGLANLWDTTSEAHNDYLKIAFETGAIGLLLFLGIFARLAAAPLSYLWEKRATNIVFIASIAVYLTLSLSDNMLHHTPVIWWFWTMWGYWLAKERG